MLDLYIVQWYSRLIAREHRDDNIKQPAPRYRAQVDSTTVKISEAG